MKKLILPFLLLLSATLFFNSCKKESPVRTDSLVVKNPLVNKWYLQSGTSQNFNALMTTVPPVVSSTNKDTSIYIQFNADGTGAENISPLTNFTYSLSGETLSVNSTNTTVDCAYCLTLPSVDTVSTLTSNSLVIHSSFLFTSSGVRYKTVYNLTYVSDKGAL